MMDIYSIMNKVTSFPEFTPQGDMAKMICDIRRVNPYEHATVHGYSMMMWQAIILETMLAELVRGSLL